MKCSRAVYSRCAVGLIIVSVILLISGLCVYFLLAEIVNNVVKRSVPLKPTAVSTGMWLNPEFDVEMSFWMFNFTNVADYINGDTVVPQLNQTGPYIFRETLKKTAWWSPDESRILYRNSKTFHHVSGNLSDRIFTLNVPLLTTVNTIHNQAFVRNHPHLETILEILAQMIERQTYVEKTVEELLFEGYEDPLFTRLRQLLPTTPARMGFFYGQNDTDDGEYVISSGVDNVADVGKILEWRDKPYVLSNTITTQLNRKCCFRNLSFWNTNSSNMINGTDGSVYAPFVKTVDSEGSPKRLPMFVSSLCRSLYVEFEKELEFEIDSAHTFNSYHFTVPASVFNDSYTANQGFCQNTDVPFFTDMPKYCHNETVAGHTVEICDTCLPSGLLNISTCQNGAPIVVSSPHFMHCSDEVFNSVEGLVRDDENHKTKVVLEPKTGAGVHFERKLQINVALAPLHSSIINLKFLNSVKPKIIPVLWINESAVMRPNQKKKLYDQIVKQPFILKVFTFVVMAVASVILLITLALWLIHLSRERSRGSDLERLINDSSTQEAVSS